MSEPKLCPYRFIEKDYYVSPCGKITGGDAVCIEDKCAMWRTDVPGEGWMDGGRGMFVLYEDGEKPDPVSYCGLVGKP